MKKAKVINILNVLILVHLFYLLWIRPYLNSATPFRDISKSLFEYFLPLFLIVCITFWIELRFNKQFKNKKITFPSNWKEHLPTETTNFILKNLVIIVSIMVFGLPILFFVFGILSDFLFG